ncbi:YAP-binding/ALF4/Glomulin [Triangularia verruculosa]|uniref:YAP-binding/ALF4/Glomulin n=1 Tax=Triangularia verruculosa TaxID=2587418 RepID=A0AAN7AX01_9PEZI|nr:YAP-binding/ALF4/Glomulin [Triangularia verruculosa]
MATTEALDPAKAITAIRDARPPATDRFTYLTIVESNLSPEVLPTLNEVLQDAGLTQEIGWDLVYNLVSLPGSSSCLQTIARLGNPREVILKVLETLELLGEEEGYEADDEVETTQEKKKGEVTKTEKFITLMGMLAILHGRIKTKYPSRFLAQTLQTVLGAYEAESEEMTAAVINLVHSLSGKRARPPLPSRKSSVNVVNLDVEGDRGKNAPDPEADDVKEGDGQTEDPDETELQQKLLLSFATCILERYANRNDLAWAGRLVEFYEPERIVPGRKTLMAAFREDEGLLAKDGIVGKLVALIGDLGLKTCSKTFLKHMCEGPLHNNPLAGSEDFESADQVKLSTGGAVCLVAYWVFSSTIFDADHPQPEMNIFPDHYAVLDKFLQDDAHTQIQQSPGTVEALVTVGLWLHSNNFISTNPNTPLTNPTTSPEDPTSDFMRYIHLVTLIALFHPKLHVRNAASTLAGQVLHSDPSDDDRLKVLYDLLENCTFASLKARAIAWLREELISASTAKLHQPTVFSTPQALETVQYVVFPSLNFLVEDTNLEEIIEYLVGNSPFLMQAVNLGLFLWSSPDKWKGVLPTNMDATVRQRWFEPLLETIERAQKESKGADVELGPAEGELAVLKGRLEDLAAKEGFTGGKGV